MTTDNRVCVGEKDLMRYIQAIQTQATMYDEIIIMARGRNIQKAIDASEVALNRFLKDWSKTAVRTGTDQRASEYQDDHNIKVSYIEIELVKNDDSANQDREAEPYERPERTLRAP